MSSSERVEPEGAAPEPEQPKSLRRSRTNRWLAGVGGGLGEYFGLHPAVYRVLFVALAFAGGTGILLYLAAALVMPAADRDESILAETLRHHRDRPWLVIGLALVALFFLLGLSGPFGHGPFFFWPGAIVFWLLVAGAVVAAAWAFRGGRRRAFAAIGVFVVLVALAVGGAFAVVGGHGGFGDVVERPRLEGELQDEYRLGAGDLELDLRELVLPPGETRVRARLGFGDLTVIVPRDLAVSATGKVGWGDVSILGFEGKGRGIRQSIADPGFDDAMTRLVVDAHVRGGELTIRR